MRKTLFAAVIMMAGLESSQTAQAYIGEGVQGRPHGGHTAQRMLYWRHGLKVPYKYRRQTH